MGLIRWLKKEIEFKRRQSAPVKVMNGYDPAVDHKEYLEKIRKFNEYRRKKNYIEPNCSDLHNEDDVTISPDSKPQQEYGDNNDTAAADKEKYSERPRQSLPGKLFRSCRRKSNRRKSSKNDDVDNHSTMIIDDVKEFEDTHTRNCTNNNESVYCLTSPPQKFYKQNSVPFPSPDPTYAQINGNERESLSIVDDPDSQQPHDLNQYSKDPIAGNASPTIMKIGTPKLSQSNCTPIKCNKKLPTKSSSSKTKSKDQRTKTHSYEIIVNQHGDQVEYAIPYSDRTCGECQKYKNQPNYKESIETATIPNRYQCEKIVTESYKFLNQIDTDDNTDSGVNCEQNRNNVLITDLDKSLEKSRTLDGSSFSIKNSEDCFRTLNQLETFSKGMSPNSKKSIIKDENSILIFKPKEIKNKTSVLRSTFTSPLDFSTGIFRKNIVTLRKRAPRSSDNSQLAEEAIQKDYEILNHIRHPNIMLLMAASINKKLINHMTLVFEPTDYTLNYLLFQMEQKLSLLETVSIIQQIASAAIFLHESGYIHSNISSHSILMRKNPWCVKLSSFELTTSVQTKHIRKDIEATYSGSIKCGNSIQKQHQKQQSMIAKNSGLEWHEKYMKMSKLSPTLRFIQNRQQSSYLKVPAKFWQYNVDYRQQFSLFHYQAPELLTTDKPFVFPTKRSDVYGLTILLWEILNFCVPFVIYNQNQIEQLYSTKEALLPIFEKDRCSLFMKIFEMGLEIEPSRRSLELEDIVSLLEEAKFAIKSDADDLIEQQRGNTLIDCDYESVDSRGLRFEATEGLVDNELERNVYENVNAISHIDDDISMNKNLPNTPINQNKEMNSNTILTQSLLDFNQCLFNSKDGERSSTMKKDRKTTSGGKKSVRNLFENGNEKCGIENDPYLELNRSLDKLAEGISLSRDDFHRDYEQQKERENVIGPVIVKENELPKVSLVRKSNSHIETPKAQIIGWKKKESADKRLRTDTDDKPTIPTTTVSIADRNKMRRNAWLSAKTFDNDIENCNNLSQLSSASKRLNVSIRIVHNQITPTANTVAAVKEKPTIKETTELENKNNERLSSSLNFQNIYSFFDQKSSSITNNLKKSNSPATNQTKRTTLPTKISNIPSSQLSTKMDNSYFDKSKNDSPKNGHFEKKLWNREKEICNKSLNDAFLLDATESSVIIPKWTSVKETIDQFENLEDSKNKTSPNVNKKPDENDSKQTPEPLSSSATLIKRTLYRESIISGVDLANLDNIFERKTKGKEHTTMVTLNLRKSLRRASDIGFESSKIASVQKQPPRPSLCPNDSRMCSIQADVFGKTVLLPSAAKDIFPTTKYICAKCEANLPLGELRALTYGTLPTPGSQRSINTLTLGDASIARNSGSAILRRKPQSKTGTTRSIQSTEDIYIDDDYCQELGANMELIADTSDGLFDSCDFDIVTTEYNM